MDESRMRSLHETVGQPARGRRIGQLAIPLKAMVCPPWYVRQHNAEIAQHCPCDSRPARTRRARKLRRGLQLGDEEPAEAAGYSTIAEYASVRSSRRSG